VKRILLQKRKTLGKKAEKKSVKNRSPRLINLGVLL
jgi:hypothetical protein